MFTYRLHQDPATNLPSSLQLLFLWISVVSKSIKINNFHFHFFNSPENHISSEFLNIYLLLIIYIFLNFLIRLPYVHGTVFVTMELHMNFKGTEPRASKNPHLWFRFGLWFNFLFTFIAFLFRTAFIF